MVLGPRGLIKAGGSSFLGGLLEGILPGFRREARRDELGKTHLVALFLHFGNPGAKPAVFGSQVCAHNRTTFALGQ